MLDSLSLGTNIGQICTKVLKIGVISGKGRGRRKGESREREEGTGSEEETRKGGNEGERGTTRGRKEEVLNGNSDWSQEEFIVKEDFIVKEAKQGNHVPTK